MQKELQIKCPVDRIDDQDFIKNELLKKLSLTKNASLNFKLIKKSIDSRKYPPVFILRYAVNKKERVITDSEKLSFN